MHLPLDKYKLFLYIEPKLQHLFFDITVVRLPARKIPKRMLLFF